jgi:hypothetical protein
MRKDQNRGLKKGENQRITRRPEGVDKVKNKQKYEEGLER